MLMDKKHSLKPVLSELERLFEHYNKELFSGKLPTPIITIQKGRPLGWFVNEKWQVKDEISFAHEINISALSLSKKTESDIPEIAVTLLHEMIHLYHFTSEIEDVATNGYHFKKIFGKAAEKYGLVVKYIDKYPGCLTTDLSNEGQKVWRRFKLKPDVLDQVRIDYVYGTKKSLRPLQCPNCKYKVQVAIGFAHRLKCQTCGSMLRGK